MAESLQMVPVEGLTARTVAEARAVLGGERRGLRAALPFIGPAVVASVAYIDPGNFATNIQAGASYGLVLLWAVAFANGVAMLFQALSARLGIATGHNLAELARAEFPAPVVYAMWVVSEIGAMATDLAEFLGGALGLSLLLHIPLIAGMVATGFITYGLLLLERRGFRPLELVITAFVAIVGLSYLIELVIAPPPLGVALRHAVLPEIPDAGALTLVVGIIGATVMPHVIYLHSGLTQNRVPARSIEERKALIRFSNREVIFALGLAGLVNMAMVMMAAVVFHAGHSDIAEIETAYRTLYPLLGAGAAAVFLTALMASGFSSSVVGTMAGQLIMQGFVGFTIPLWLRRVLTMAPAFVVIGLGVAPTQALVMSQVVLSLVLPVPMIALLVILRRPRLGAFAIGPRLFAFTLLLTAVILGLNLLLILQTFGVPVPGLG